jgi:transmembrane sensor
MNKTEKYTDKDWEKLASQFSDEATEPSDKLGRFREEDHFSTEKQWNEMRNLGNRMKIDVDKAWNKTYSRIEENGLLSKTDGIKNKFRIQTLIRIAAAALIITGLGVTMLYLNKTSPFAERVVVASNKNEKNIEISLPDGSKVFLNRNSELSYNKNLGQSSRNVTLKGEAFFDIKRNPSMPFIINAGEASVKVLGTTFSVLTSNANNSVEVFVKTGNVMISDNAGTQKLILEPGFIGVMNSKSSSKKVNEDPNYLSWNTDSLTYNGIKLDVVFSDLKKVYNIDVVAENPEILNEAISTTFYKQPQDSIIQVICATFIFSYKKEGTVYHLSKR